MQVLLADVMVHPIDPALQGRKITFDRVRGDAQAVLLWDVLFRHVIHLIVLASLQRAF